VVHRDIKPDNILVSGRHVLVTDFGVAKAVSESGGQSLTSLGVALGTPAYMAPEQASADPHVDHRADIYALGAMAYEMLSGQPPFTGPNPQAILAAHVMQVPATVSAARPAVPATLNAVIMRCLEKRPSDRWQTAEELGTQLDTLLTPSGGMTPTGATAPVSSGTEAAIKRAHPVRVAVLFAIASAVVLSLVWLMVHRLGLPDWVFYAGIALMAAGLPIMLLTSNRERQRAMARITGSHAIPSNTLMDRLLTWRGAISGGGLAFAGLTIGAGVFMGLRTAGIGPFATLVSSGVMKERDKLIVADFENRTSDSTLGQSVTEALRIDLAQSPMVRLLETGDVAAALQRMERDPSTPITAKVAQEIAAREGAKAVVSGEIAPLGASFVLSVRLINAGTGATMLAERETAADATGLIAAVDRLSKKVREGIGESLRSIRSDEPLEEVTTSSLEALRKYSQAERLADAGRNEEARDILEETLRLDSTFAMAWRKLGVVLGNSSLDNTRRIEAVRRAYELRDRLPERERLITTAYYHNDVAIDVDKMIQAYEQALEQWPDDATSLNNLALAYNWKRRFADAERVARHGVDISPHTGVLWSNLIEAQILQGHLAAADSSLARMGQVAPEARNRYPMGYRLAWAKADYQAAAAYADSVGQSTQPSLQALARFQKASLSTLAGRLAEAERGIAEGIEMNVRRGAPEAVYNPGIAQLDSWLRSEPQRALRYMDSVLLKHPLDSLTVLSRPYLQLAIFYAQAGNANRAEQLIRDYERLSPREMQAGDDERYAANGMLALAQGKPADAIAAFRTYRERQGWCNACYLFEIGVAFDALQQPDSALVAYETLATAFEPGPGFRQVTLPLSYRRLGELSETKGDKQKAIEYYGKFVDLWKGADPELQPKVKDVQKRIGELAGEKR
jgi:Flp pilus assembly protein TadD